jgi:hypothetical protein
MIQYRPRAQMITGGNVDLAYFSTAFGWNKFWNKLSNIHKLVELYLRKVVEAGGLWDAEASTFL